MRSGPEALAFLPMPGMNLFDALTVAARRMNDCCVQTMNLEIGDRPKAPHVSVDGGGTELAVTVSCAECKTKSVIRTDGASVKVETFKGQEHPAVGR